MQKDKDLLQKHLLHVELQQEKFDELEAIFQKKDEIISETAEENLMLKKLGAGSW